MASAYDRLMGTGGRMGQIEIVGDEAAMVTEADKGVVTYVEAGYKVADKTYVGLGNGVALPGGGVITPLQVPVITPFKPLKMIIPSWAAPGLVVVNVQIGPTQLIDGNPMPADAFTEVSTINHFSWPTVEMSQNITVQIQNRGAALPFFDMGFYGIRLRK